MEAAVIVDLKEFAKQQFKAAQRPVAWLLSAERLRDAADAIMKHELSAEIPYFRAYKIAQEEALASAYSDGNDAGVSEIKAMPPNYPPAQLMYAYAIENVLKGLVVSKRPDLVQEGELDDELAIHNLIKLADKAEFAVHVQERPVLEALSQLSIWAGRYPVARTQREFLARRTPTNCSTMVQLIRSCACSSSGLIRSSRAGCHSQLVVALDR